MVVRLQLSAWMRVGFEIQFRGALCQRLVFEIFLIQLMAMCRTSGAGQAGMMVGLLSAPWLPVKPVGLAFGPNRYVDLRPGHTTEYVLYVWVKVQSRGSLKVH